MSQLSRETGAFLGQSQETGTTLDRSEEKQDTNVINWDGPEDPENPQKWPKSSRVGHVVLASMMTLISNLASTMFAPGAAQLMAEFHSTSSVLGTLSVTIYLLGFVTGPLLIAPLSEIYGRLPIYHACNIIFLAFIIGGALSTDLATFLVFRFITGCAGSAPLTIGGGTVVDVVPQESRGAAMAVFAMGPLLEPVIGPTIGGFVTEYAGWRWAFWVLAIMSGTVSLAALAFRRETYANVLLQRKTLKLRKETDNESLVSKTDRGLEPRILFLRSIILPIKMLVLSPIVLSLSTYCAFVFGLTFLLFTTFSSVFEDQYGFSAGVSGLSYLGLGIGMMVGLVVFGILSDKVLKQKSGSQVSKPEFRLPLMLWFCPTIPIGFFVYGWSVNARVHWIVPILGTGLIGLGSLFIIMPAQIYLVNAFGAQGAASALAANTVLRSLFGTFLPLAGPSLYSALGLGWGNSLLGFLAVVFTPVPFLFYRYGEWMRERWVMKV